MKFSDFQTEDRRLVILRALENAAQYRTNAYLLQRYCDAVGHVVSLDRVVADLAWLAEGSLVKLDQQPDIAVAELTPRGLDVATGRAQHPGVAKPKPGV